MKITEHGKILTAISKPYDFEGRSGVSHRIRVLVDGEIFACKSSEEQVKLLKEAEGAEGEVTLLVTSPKEAVSVSLESFVED